MTRKIRPAIISTNNDTELRWYTPGRCFNISNILYTCMQGYSNYLSECMETMIQHAYMQYSIKLIRLVTSMERFKLIITNGRCHNVLQKARAQSPTSTIIMIHPCVILLNPHIRYRATAHRQPQHSLYSKMNELDMFTVPIGCIGIFRSL